MHARSKLKKVALAGPAECLSEQNAISPIKIGQKLRPVLCPRNHPFLTQTCLTFFDFLAIKKKLLDQMEKKLRFEGFIR